mmetsp:Transcript_2193/g.4300  ORF Transcript_2193/g.4300 Transcript_2193/m.4300 type:complete len:153 (-) Transcript_2193:1254-1712(-)
MTAYIQVELDKESEQANEKFSKIIKESTKDKDRDKEVSALSNSNNFGAFGNSHFNANNALNPQNQSHSKFQPRMLIELFNLVKINRVVNIERLGTMIKKYDDERNMMKNNIEQNNRMQEMFVEKDNMIKKKDEELERIHEKCERLENMNDEQ